MNEKGLLKKEFELRVASDHYECKFKAGFGSMYIRGFQTDNCKFICVKDYYQVVLSTITYFCQVASQICEFEATLEKARVQYRLIETP